MRKLVEGRALFTWEKERKNKICMRLELFAFLMFAALLFHLVGLMSPLEGS